MNSKHLYLIYIYVFVKYVNCQQYFAQQPNYKHAKLQETPNFDIFSETSLSDINSRFEELFSPQHIFQKLFDPEGVVPDPVQKCIEKSKSDESKCWNSLCELFLAIAEFLDPEDPRNVPVPQWAVKSKFSVIFDTLHR